MKTVPRCPYCQAKSELVGGEVIYPHRQDLAHKRFYRCEPCGAWVGCNDGSTAPFGRLANAELRGLKSAAHAAFDPIWKRKMSQGHPRHSARGDGYAWLAKQLGIAVQDCHIGMFDEKTCRRVVELCQPHQRRNVA